MRQKESPWQGRGAGEGRCGNTDTVKEKNWKSIKITKKNPQITLRIFLRLSVSVSVCLSLNVRKGTRNLTNG